MITELTTLDSGELSTLSKCEATIDKNKTAFLEVGNALKTIQEGKLYRDTHTSFQKYVEERHDFKKSWAYLLIEKAEVTANVSSALDGSCPDLPIRQVEALATLPADQQADAYQEAAERRKGTPTTSSVILSVESRLPDDERDNEPDDEPEGEEARTVEQAMAESNRALESLARGITGNQKRADELADDILGYVETARAIDTPHLDETQLGILESQLKAAANGLRQAGDDLAARLKTAAGLIRARKGAGRCAYCRGKGEGCEPCRGSGWLTSTQLASAPREAGPVG